MALLAGSSQALMSDWQSVKVDKMTFNWFSDYQGVDESIFGTVQIQFDEGQGLKDEDSIRFCFQYSEKDQDQWEHAGFIRHPAKTEKALEWETKWDSPQGFQNDYCANLPGKGSNTKVWQVEGDYYDEKKRILYVDVFRNVYAPQKDSLEMEFGQTFKWRMSYGKWPDKDNKGHGEQRGDVKSDHGVKDFMVMEGSTALQTSIAALFAAAATYVSF